MKLKLAFSYSALIHVGLLALKPLGGGVTQEQAPPSLRPMTYLEVESVLPVEGLPASPKVVSSLKSDSVQPVSTTSIAAPSKTAASASNLSPKPQTRVERPIVTSLPDAPAKPPASSPSTEAAVPKVRVPPEGIFARIQHKRAVREHLRTHLHYPAAWLKGWVRLQVLIDRDGALRLLRVMASSNPVLAQKAENDARSAIPYPAFPQAFKGQQARYEFMVQYEPE